MYSEMLRTIVQAVDGLRRTGASATKVGNQALTDTIERLLVDEDVSAWHVVLEGEPKLPVAYLLADSVLHEVRVTAEENHQDEMQTECTVAYRAWPIGPGARFWYEATVTQNTRPAEMREASETGEENGKVVGRWRFYLNPGPTVELGSELETPLHPNIFAVALSRAIVAAGGRAEGNTASERA